MDEYYCPNCNAILNDQAGFDPDNGTWTCQVCGQTLYGDDLEDTMSSYPGVVWYCDSCGAVLNKQSGFDDSCGAWYCTECGHRNPISEDEIYESEEDYQTHKNDSYCSSDYDDDNDEHDENEGVDEYYCPNCHAILNDQYGFDPDNGTWTCQVCGQSLYGDNLEDTMNSFPGVVWYCDSCGAVLNKQSGFNDSCGYWYCTECGHCNPISEDEIYESEEDYQNNKNSSYSTTAYNDDDDDEDNEDDTASDNLGISNSGGDSSFKTDELREYAKRAVKKEKARKRRKKYWKIWIVLIIISAAGLYIGYRINEYRKLTAIGISAVECKDSSYTEIKRTLQAAGFTNISTKAIEDLSFENLEQEGQIIAVTISGQTDFSADTKFPYDSQIIIEHHSAARIKPPIAPKDAKGSSCDDILKLFQDAGFGAVSLEADYDLLFGWINTEGSVEGVSINGDTKYSIDSYYRVDAEIVIVYHAFRRDKDG